MADGGLPTMGGAAAVGAGLDAPTTMREQTAAANDPFLKFMMGNQPAPADTMGGEPEDPSVGILGEMAYGGRRALDSAFTGAGDLLSDMGGNEAVADSLRTVGDWVAPSDEQEAAQARQAADPDRSFLDETGDLVAQEAAPTVAPVAAAAAGALVAGPVGAAVGAGAGFLFNYLRGRDETRNIAKQKKAEAKYGEGVTQEQIDATELDEDDLFKVDATAAGVAALDYVAPLKAIRRIAPGRAMELGREAVQRGVAKSAGRKVAADAMTEATTEVAQSALQELVFDPELRQRITEDEWAELAPWLVDTYGREFAQTALVGGAIGAGMGGATGAYEQKMINAKRKNDVRVLGEAGANASVDLGEFEAAARDPERVGQMAEDADRIRAADASLRQAQRSLDEYAAQVEEQRDPQIMADLEASRDRAQRTFDAAHDEIMPRYGGMRKSDVQARERDVAKQATAGTVERARAQGYELDEGFDPASVNAVLDPVEEARAELDTAQRKADTTVDERFRSKYAKDAKKAKQRLRAAEINARRTIYGETAEEATQQLDREAGIARHRQRLFGDESDAEGVVAKADAVIAERKQEGKVKETRAAAREKIAKLYKDLDAAETETQIDEIETKIAKEQAKLKQPDPLVEAATRAKRDALRSLGIEPSAVETGDMTDGVDAVEEGDGGPVPEAGLDSDPTLASEGEALADASPTTDAVEDAFTAPNINRDGVHLPEEHDRYFDATPDTTTVPVAQLRPIRQRPTGVSNAGKFMREAYDGTKERRKPISVRAEEDGTYTVLDGNSTYANMADAGWIEAPVRVVTDEQFAAESAPKFGEKTKTKTSVEGSTIIARGPESRRDAVTKRAEKEGLTVRFEPETVIPRGDARRRGPGVDGRHPWRDQIDVVGPDAKLDDVETWLEENQPEIEYMAAFGPDGALLGFGTNDHENAVAQPELGAKTDGVTYVHNHPVDTPFSGADIATLAGPRPIAALRVVTPSGRYEVRPTETLTKLRYPAAQKTVAAIMNRVAEASPKFSDPTSRARVQQEAVLRVAEEEGLVEYTEPFGSLTDAEEEMVNAIFDQVTGAAPADAQLRPDAGAGTAAPVQDRPDGGSGTEQPAAAARDAGRDRGLTPEQRIQQWKDASAQTFPTVDAMLRAAPANNARLAEIGATVSKAAGTPFLQGPIKTRDSIERKTRTKGVPPGSLGDVVRGGFIVDTEEQAARVIDALDADPGIELVAEEWRVTPAGYFDRTAILRMPDGMLAEIQIWPRQMLLAKSGLTENGMAAVGFDTGHRQYEIERDPSQPAAARQAARDAMRRLYASAAAAADPSIRQVVAQRDASLLREADPELSRQMQAALAEGAPRQAAAVDLRTGKDSLENYGLPGPGPHKTRDIAAAIEDRQRKLHGTIKRGDYSDAAKAKIADWMAEEVEFELALAKAGGDSGAGWYGEKFQRALDAFSGVYPELARGASDMQGTVFASPTEARDYLTALIAITSDGEKVYTNFKRAAQLYGEGRTTGILPDNTQSTRGASMRENTRRINELWGEHGAGMKEYLLEEATLSDINKQLRAMGKRPETKYQAHMMMPRAAALFGPKLGAFYANLSGADGYLTMDRWWSRTFNRYRGNLLDKPSARGKARVKQLLADELGVSPKMSDDRMLQRISPFVKSYADKGYKNGTELERAANTVWKAAVLNLNDVPFGAKDRTFMIDTVKAAQERLAATGNPTNVADIQAILWYYEKRLYAEMGARATPDISYEETAHRVVRETNGASSDTGDAGGAGQTGLRGPDGAELSSDLGQGEAGIGDTEVRVAAGTDAERDGGNVAGRARGGSRRTESGELTPLEGAPTLRGHKGPIQDVVRVAEDYAARNGIDLRPQAVFVDVDEARAKRIADAYEAMPHAPNDPAVREAYDELIRQTRAQYDALADAGYQFGFFAPDSEYGASPVTAMEDLRLNKHMLIFPTAEGFGSSDADVSGNPLNELTDLQWPDEQGNLQPVYANDLFRAVHDAFGHGMEGSGFRANGEENAWQAHIRLFTGPAKGAITTETRGQNSWLNYGPYAETNQTAAVEDTVFADQKTGLMPEWTWTEGLAPDAPDTPSGGPGSGARPTDLGEARIAHAKDMERVAPQIRDVLANKDVKAPIALTNAPVIAALVGRGQPVVLPQGVIWKANSDKHGLTGQKIIDAMDTLLEPMMVFDSKSGNGLVAVSPVPGEDRLVATALHPNERIGQLQITRVASIHPKDSDGSIASWLKDGLLRYVDRDKAGAWSRSTGRQLPTDTASTPRPGQKVLQHRDVFKPADNKKVVDPENQPMRPGEPAPLYVRRDVNNDGGLRKWAEAAGIEGVLPQDKMHLTVTYSRAPVDIADAPARGKGRNATATGELAMLGTDNDTLVMKLRPAGLEQDHQRYRAAGASHDYGDGYLPHITLKYGATQADFEKAKAAPPFTGQIQLGPEVQARLKPQRDDTPGARIAANVDRVALGDLLLSEDGMATAAAAGPDAKISDAPVTVTETPDGRLYLVDGYHRYSAAQRAGAADIAIDRVPFDRVAILYNNEKLFTDGSTPVTRVAAAVDMPSYIDSGYHPGTHAAMKSITHALRNPRISTQSWLQKLEDGFFNGFAPIRRLELAVNGDLGIGAESAYKAAEMAVNDTGRNEALMYYGAAKLGQHGEFTVAPGTKGLRTIFDEVAASTGKKRDPQALADWMGYMAARRAQDLHARGIATPLSDADIQKALGKETPAFKQAAADWKAHNDANIDFLVDTGRITKDQARAMKAEEHYVPFYRSSEQMANGASPDFSLDDYLGNRGPGRAGSGALLKRDPGIKKIVGGDRMAIDNIMLNMVRNSQAMVAAGMRNRAANQTFDLMETAGLAKTVKATKVSKKTGNIVRKEKPKNSVRMWENGREKFVVVDEQGAPLVAALGGLHPRQLGAIEQLLNGVASIFRQGITLSPAFMIRNAIRGAVSTGLLTSGANLTASNNFFTGFRDALRQGDATAAFKHMSGMGDYRFGGVDAGFGENDILIDYGLAPKTIMSRLRSGLDKAEKVGTATELADRVAAFRTLQANGVRADEAAYQGLTIMNYSRRGNNAAVRLMMPMIPFLNARLQGLSRLTEGAAGKTGAMGRKQALMQLAINGALLSLASAAMWAWTNGDEEDREKYLAEPMFRKLNYHILYAGDKTIYLPKAFELGALFSTIPEMALNSVANDMGDQFVPAMGQIMAQTFLFNAIPAAVLPYIEVSTNYSYFRDGPIEGMRESGLRARDRTTGASPVSTLIGQKLGLSDASGLSPVQIEHYLQGYGGAYYNLLSSAVEIAGSELGLIPATPGGALGSAPVASAAAERMLGSLVRATPQQSDKYIGEFYETKDYIDQIYSSAKAAATNGDVEYARSLLAQVPGLDNARKLMNKIAPKMTELNSAIRLTRQDRKLTRKQKADRLAPLVKARNALSKQVMDVVRQIEEAQGAKFKRVA